MTIVDSSPILVRRNRGRAKQIATVLTTRRKGRMWINASRFNSDWYKGERSKVHAKVMDTQVSSDVSVSEGLQGNPLSSEEGSSSNADVSPILVQLCAKRFLRFSKGNLFLLVIMLEW